MHAITLFARLGPVDLKNIRRDSMLMWIPAIPIVIALIFRIAIPDVASYLQDEFAFDLEPYYPLMMSFFMVMTASVAGMIVGFLLLDERDDQTLTALMVTPISLNGYLLYRISLPVLGGFLVTLIGYPIAGLTTNVSFGIVLAVALLGSLSAPLMALFLVSFADNKVAGFAMLKLMNGILLIPSVSYFITSDWQILAGLVPTYWSLKVFWLAADGVTGAILIAYLVAGFASNFAALYYLLRRFNRVIAR